MMTANTSTPILHRRQQVGNTNTLSNRALAAYFRRFGRNAPQPASPVIEEHRDGLTVVLSNVNGILAEFRFSNGRLRYRHAEHTGGA